MKLGHVYTFIFLLLPILNIECGTLTLKFPRKQWADLEKWDTNGEKRLDVDEFIEGYCKSKFFNRWECKSGKIGDSVFLQKMFGYVDRNNDIILDSSEYNSRRMLWSLPGTHELKKWDISGDEIITYNEFIQGAQRDNLIRKFDITMDGQITEVEMAQAMFYVCDKDNNNSVGAIEFYLWEVYRQ